MATIEKKKAEAVRRMKKLKMYAPLIKEFKENGMVEISEPPMGACYWLNDEQKEFVKKFEQEHKAVVFHAILSVTEFGTLETYLFVSDYEEEWEYDDADLNEGYALAYVRNLDAPWCSEMGTVVVKLTVAGGLKRIA